MYGFDNVLRQITFPDSALRPRAGDRMPALPLATEDGEPLDLLAGTRRGPVLVLFFRGFWCTVCRAQFAELAPVLERVAAMGGASWAVSVDAPATIAQHTRKQQIAHLGYASIDEQALASVGLLFATTPKNLAVPSAWLVDPRGVLSFVHYASKNGDRATSAQLLEALRVAR